MKAVELIYDHDCPNVEQTRTFLLSAFSEVGIPAEWAEWDGGDSSSPSRVRSYGSPTILVDGKDVANEDPSENISCCRLYAGPNGEFSGSPTVEVIAAALRTYRDKSSSIAAQGQGERADGRASLAVLPGIGASLVLIGVLGLGFLLETSYLLPVTGLFLIMAVAALGYRARMRRGYRPFVLGFVASATVLVGKFIFESNTAMYGGLLVLIAASLWNAWPRKLIGSGKETFTACASCEAGMVTDKNGGIHE